MLTNQALASSENVDFWDSCLNKIQEKVGPTTFETWFRTTDLNWATDGHANVLVPNQFFADFIEEHFGTLVVGIIEETRGSACQVSYIPTQKDWSIVVPLSQTISTSRERDVPRVVSREQRFHANYSFDSFIIGDSNRMAHAAAMAVAEAPGKTSFNPLVIYGGTGLGKTHLMQALGHFAQSEDTAEHVMYLTSEEFIRQYIDYVLNKRDSMSFHKRFDTVDLLLIDDIQFFKGKPGTQKEFYRIFNRLLHENKQIVLTSDRPPDMIPDMMEHIISRFLGGMVADIQPPNLETRIAILKKKAEIDGYNLPDEVVGYLATSVTSNVRELEGMLIKLIAHSSFTGHDITLAVAQHMCGDLVGKREDRLSVQSIQRIVAENFGLSPNQLSAHTRRRDVTGPRAVAMFLCKKLTRQSLHTIGVQFGGRDYTTVVHACKKIESDIARDETLRTRIAQLEAALLTGSAA